MSLQCIENCDICSNQTNCQVCQEGYCINQLTQCQVCIPSCQMSSNSLNCDLCLIGYYVLDQKCEQCNHNCLTCNELSDQCITCRSNYEINSNNQFICQNGYNEEQNHCYRCEYPCKTCLRMCPVSNLQIDSNFQCNCSPGYFWNQKSCSECYQSCLSCINDQYHCLSCEQRLNRILNNNKCVCTQNYFESEDEVCISCQDQLDKSQEKCRYQDCQDQIWTYGEECDDGNDVNRDGCSNCKIDHNFSCFNKILKQSICFQCSTNCIQCLLNPQTKKSQCIKCQVGYFLDKNDCVQCSINCVKCIDQAYNCISCKFSQEKNQKCQVCESGYYADEINRTCLNKCGDQIKTKEEECDDGNLVKGDGCDDQCMLEENYIFLNGVSIVSNYPKPLLHSINTSQVIQSYTTHIVITEGFQIKDYLSVHIQSNNSVKQIYQNFQLIQDISQINKFNQSEFNLMINITFTRSSQDEILLIKFLNNSVIFSNEGYSQIETEVFCLFPKVTFIDDVTITQVQLTTEMIFGGVEVFFNLLDTLQMLSYLKYINVQLPYNLQTYFELFGFAQFNFIQKFFNLSEFIDEILNAKQLKKIPRKIANDITSLFIINSATITTVWISLFCINAVAKMIPKFYIHLNLNFILNLRFKILGFSKLEYT
ncbi:unnamed protein product [Paramecium sonneborni]|uniref:4Fe-4S ferredoxin-type domain-containing protein n=1 Tax=Paramecium sonneborni TaxID=65129 RepID=A0A8S1PLB9_9CILI|nr:unnamed protein product [Paramecium sonneborni]